MPSLKRHLARLSAVLALLAAYVPAAYAAIPDSEIPGNADISTIWVVGDIDMVARTFSMIAMLFNSDSGSMVISAIQLAILIAITLMCLGAATSMKLEPFKTILMIIFLAFAIIPTTPVYVASYYDQALNSNTGAVRFRKVDNIPVGVAWTLGLFSKLGKSFTEGIDTASSVVPDVNWTGTAAVEGPVAGNLSVHGTQGFFSPLRTLMQLRRQFNTPENALIMTNMAIATRSCGWNVRWSDVSKEGFLRVLTSGHQSGMTQIMVPDPASGGKAIQTSMNCADAGKIIAAQVLSHTTPATAQSASAAANQIVATRNMSGSSGVTLDSSARAVKIQTELDELPGALASQVKGSSSSNPRPADVLTTAYAMAKQSGTLTPNALAQYYSAGVQIDAASIQASMIFNQIANQCIGAQDASCTQAAAMMTDAIGTSAVDAAGEASIFQTLAEGFLNLMLCLYIGVTPLMVFMIVIRGWAGFKLLGMYIMLAAWINAWLPIDTLIAHFMQQNLMDNLYKATLAIMYSGTPNVVLSPGFTAGLFDSIQKSILTGSSLMAYIPTILFFILSGSVYGFAAIANRANLVGQNAIKEELEAPDLHKTSVIGAERMIQNAAQYGPVESMEDLQSNAYANSPTTFNLAMTDSQTETAKRVLSAQASALGTTVEQMTFAHVDSDGVATSSGWVIDQATGQQASARYVEAGTHVMADSTTKGIGGKVYAGADGSLKLSTPGAELLGYGASASAKAGAMVELSANGQTSDTNSTSTGSEKSEGTTTSSSVTNRNGLTMTATSLDSQTLQQVHSQTLSDLRSDMSSLENAASLQQSGSSATSIDQKMFNEVMINVDRDSQAADIQRNAAITAAEQYSDKVAQTIMDAGRFGGNANGALFDKLMAFNAGGSDEERLAANAAMREIFNHSDMQGIETHKAMLEGRMDMLEHQKMMQGQAAARINQDIVPQNAASLGSFRQDLNVGERLGGTRNLGPQVGEKVNSMGMTIAEQRKVIEANNAMKVAAIEEKQAIEKKLRQRSSLEKIADGAASITHLTEESGGGLLGKTALFDDTDALNKRYAELNKMLDNYNPNDSSKTFDGSSLENIIGRKLTAPTADQMLDYSDQNHAPSSSGLHKTSLNAQDGGSYLPTDREGLTTLAHNKAFGGEAKNGVKTQEGVLAMAHAMEKLFDTDKQDVRFSAFNDSYHVEHRPNSTHVRGLALDMVLDQEGKSTQALGTGHTSWMAAEHKIRDFMQQNGFGDKDYYVDYEKKGEGGATGDHIHFNFKNQAAAERFERLAESGQVRGLGEVTSSSPTTASAAPDNAAPMSALRSLISKGEGGYNSVNLGERYGQRAATRNLTSMTVNEIMAAQRKKEFNTVGRYQMTPPTFASGVKALGLSGNEKFTPELQERFFSEYLIGKAGGGAALDFIKGKHNDINKAMIAMAQEWASFPVPHAMKGHVQQVAAGQSYYHGVGNNKAHLSLSDVRAALLHAKSTFGGA